MPKVDHTYSPVMKFDDELQIVWAEVYVPDVPDSQGEYMTADEIQKMAHKFMKSGNTGAVDVQHDNEEYGSAVVESFIAREGDPVFVEGAWVVGVHILSPKVWKMVKDGELNGFSMEAWAVKVPTELEIDIPASVTGLTSERNGHVHKFEVNFGEAGALLGGKTDEAEDGHSHQIVKGTVTEPGGADGHTHTFSVVEGF